MSTRERRQTYTCYKCNMTWTSLVHESSVTVPSPDEMGYRTRWYVTSSECIDGTKCPCERPTSREEWDRIKAREESEAALRKAEEAARALYNAVVQLPKLPPDTPLHVYHEEYDEWSIRQLGSNSARFRLQDDGTVCYLNDERAYKCRRCIARLENGILKVWNPALIS